ncbi:MAG TPA: hypothetical protein VHT26_13305 [Trebonia sp.]|nr:hypothetical protein [Trebonia sp.]
MTTQPSDEDILIQEARSERGQHRSGASMAGMLGVAMAFGVVGCLLLLVPHLIGMLLPLPVSLLLGGFSLPVFTTLGIVALGIAAFFLLAGFASSPLASWGNKLPGDCPTCGEARLRSDTVPGGTSGAAKGAPRGIVTLCETSGCGYATARVTRASGAASAE